MKIDSYNNTLQGCCSYNLECRCDAILPKKPPFHRASPKKHRPSVRSLIVDQSIDEMHDDAQFHRASAIGTKVSEKKARVTNRKNQKREYDFSTPLKNTSKTAINAEIPRFATPLNCALSEDLFLSRQIWGSSLLQPFSLTKI